MGKEPIAYNDGRPVFEGQIEPDYTKFTWQHSLWDSVDDRIRASTIAVAAVLTDHANMETCVAWPSLETIARCSRQRLAERYDDPRPERSGGDIGAPR